VIRFGLHGLTVNGPCRSLGILELHRIFRRIARRPDMFGNDRRLAGDVVEVRLRRRREGQHNLIAGRRHGLQACRPNGVEADVASMFCSPQHSSAVPGLDINAIWSTGLQTVTAAGNQVVLDLRGAVSAVYFYYVAGQTRSFPNMSGRRAIRRKIRCSSRMPSDRHGPFTVNPCNPNLITYTANTGYWQPGLPHLAKVLYPHTRQRSRQPRPRNDKRSGAASTSLVSTSSTRQGLGEPPHVVPADGQRRAVLQPQHEATGKLGVRQPLPMASTGQRCQRSAKVGCSRLPTRAASSFRPMTTVRQVHRFRSTRSTTTKAIEALATAGYSKDNPLKLDVITIEATPTGCVACRDQTRARRDRHRVDDQRPGPDHVQRPAVQGRLRCCLRFGDRRTGAYYELRQLLYGPNTAELGQNAAPTTSGIRPGPTQCSTNTPRPMSTTQHTIVNQLRAGDVECDPVCRHRVCRLVRVQHAEDHRLADTRQPLRQPARTTCPTGALSRRI